MKNPLSATVLFSLPFLFLFSIGCNQLSSGDTKAADATSNIQPEKKQTNERKKIDTADYNRRMLALSNNDTTGIWPVKAPYPLAGAILPYNRIVAFYGNLYSKKMGILGELPKDEMLKKLKGEVALWQAADEKVGGGIFGAFVIAEAILPFVAA